MKDIEKERQYLAPLIKVVPKARPRSAGAQSRRNVTKKYFLLKDGSEVQVCLGFFLSIFNISETFVRYIQKNRDSSKMILSADKRVHHRPGIRRSDETRERIRNHIKSFPTVPSHYCRQSTVRQFLLGDLSIQIMHELYKKRCEEAQVTAEKYWLYREIFNTEFNLAFHVPRKNLCDHCYRFQNLSEENQEAEKDQHSEHLKRKEAARKLKNELKERAKAGECHLLEFDLEAVR